MSGGFDIDVASDPVYRIVGIILAILSGVLIGVSFILKKKGLISSRVVGEGNLDLINRDANKTLEDGHGYLKSPMWWSGMILMALGEIANFIAYALAPAVLVTPLGALSVVVSAVLSSILLKERLNFHGKIGCIICLLGSVIVVMHAPEQNAPSDMEGFKQLALAPGFLVYTIIIIITSIVLVYKVAPKYGDKHPLVYISICSFIGSLSVVCLQSVGSSVIATFNGNNQFTNWFIYIVIVFVVLTILTQINYLNKALNLFVTAEITPIYYVVFTTATIISSAILYQGFKATAVSIVTLILAFFSICGGVIILQTSRMNETIKNETTASLMEYVSEKGDKDGGEAHLSENGEPISDFNETIVTRDPNLPTPIVSSTTFTEPEVEIIVDTANPRPSLGRSFTSPRPIPARLTNTVRSKTSIASSISQDSNNSKLGRLGYIITADTNDHLKPRTVFTDDYLEASHLFRKSSTTNGVNRHRSNSLSNANSKRNSAVPSMDSNKSIKSIFQSLSNDGSILRTKSNPIPNTDHNPPSSLNGNLKTNSMEACQVITEESDTSSKDKEITY